MRIQHNIMAMNSYRNFSNNTKAVGKNLEKLSSGYRINNAGDDAAGLAVSEKMRAQITGLKTAQKNAKDGISLVKTAEGALTEVHSMLNRMVDLAGQSANGTYDNEVDRANLQKEVDALKEEVNRIADSSNFNGIKLLDGTQAASQKADIAGDIALGTSKVTTSKTASAAFTAGTTLAANDTFSYTVAWKDGKEEKSATVSFKANTTGQFESADGTKYDLATAGAPTAGEIGNAVMAELKKNGALTDAFEVTLASDKLTFTSKVDGSKGAQVTALGMTASNATATPIAAGAISATAGDVVVGKDAMQKLDLSKVDVLASGAEATEEDINKAIFEVDGKKFLLANSGATATELKNVASDVNIIKIASAGGADYAATAADATIIASEISRITGKTFEKAAAADTGADIALTDILYKGEKALNATGSDKGGLTLQIGDTAESFNQMKVSIGDMHVDALGIKSIDISTQEGGAAAMEAIKNAINSVSSTRGDLGALQNRLDHTINNLSVMHENIQDAEATIRDTDVADEMMAYTKNNILVQSAQAMLAQANQVPQGVLQLLG